MKLYAIQSNIHCVLFWYSEMVNSLSDILFYFILFLRITFYLRVGCVYHKLV